ncbi:MAG: aminoacyl-tRNA hydrolase [Putridiphycobacter sp.]|nr:aminoacyl-tRNA hydrolase [Putridiphycobacter sp.]
MKYLIVGLGNPGSEYANTRHNIGFMVLDALMKVAEESFETEKLGDIGKLKFKGRTLILLKPSTYMNLSGKAVNYWMTREKIKPDNILVITDDLALPFGKLRMKGKGSHAGHNGLRDIIAVLNSSTFPRLKFGIGNDFHPGQQANYVLSEWNSEEKDQLPERIEMAHEFIKGFVTIGLDKTMSTYNNK